MKILGIDHVAILCQDLDGMAEPFLTQLGLTAGTREQVAAQRTEAYFLLPGQGDACLELIASRDNPGLDRFLARRGNTLHHVAFLVDDLAGALAELAVQGVPLIDREPRPGARRHQVAFIHPSATGGVLVELVGTHRP